MKRAIFIGVIAAAPLAACGSDGAANGGGNGNGNGNVPAGAVGSYQNPPPNPQEALPNPEQPPRNTSAPLNNDQAPVPNPEQPVPPGTPSAGGQNPCESICIGIGACSGACQDQCSIGMGAGECAAPIAAFIQCAQSLTLSLVCDDRGRVVLPDGTACRDQWRAVTECFTDQPSDNSGPDNGNNRGRGRQNDAGLPAP